MRVTFTSRAAAGLAACVLTLGLAACTPPGASTEPAQRSAVSVPIPTLTPTVSASSVPTGTATPVATTTAASKTSAAATKTTAASTTSTQTTEPSQTPKATSAATTNKASSQGAVKAAEVRSIEIPELGFKDSSVFPISTSAMGGAIDPPRYDGSGPSGVVRVSDKGVMPASSTDDTTYLSCHTSIKYGPDAYPCDRLTRKVADGDHIVLTTDAGTLTYTVTHERSIPYDDFASDKESWDYVPNRVVLVMCDILEGNATGANYVVYATLKS